MIKLFNTLGGKIELFHPLQEGEIKLYTCGPTVYDYPHIGNHRAYMFEDLLKRFLVFMGYKVIHVMNITDIDDKTIKGANEKGVSLSDYTGKYIQAFFEDIETLNIVKADHYPRATENIQEMAEMVKGLLEKGYAYEKDGSFYFNISKFKDYGKLANVDLKELKTGIRIDSDEYEKERVHDFALWKARKEGEPFWETALGPGRPGWHIECSLMSAKYLGDTFDIHCGGVDNIFPHHENEIAQSEAYSGKKFVNYWLHCQHLIRDGEKMSKSKGNIITPKQLIENQGADPMAIRLLLLSTHYRKMLNFTMEALNQAKSSLDRINEFVNQLASATLPEAKNQEVSSLIDDMKKKFIEGLSNDLNISSSLTAVFEMIKKANRLMVQGEVFQTDAENLIRSIASINKVLGTVSFPINIKVSGALSVGEDVEFEFLERQLPPEIWQKIQEREKARQDKNFALADKIRDELLAQGIALEDTKDGVRWKIVRK
ncbi:MAG: cysteine--tRNA ligase [Candidatus Aminicenantes bacterium]|nr:cysteine--tRNA ligase [Candidatus Aminicenantes bacterium]MDH5385329.1 cysteine--tRNA ligase [Candidatus Aminicenantes bacterium]